MLMRFAKIVKKLSSKSEKKREEAMNELMQLNIDEIQYEHLHYLIESTAKVYQDTENHLADASSVLMEFIAKYDITPLVSTIEKTFPSMSVWARSVALTLLTRVQTDESLESLLFLLDTYIDEYPIIDFHMELTGEEEECAEILFPKLFEYIEYPDISYTINRYIWSCLNKGTLNPNDLAEQIPVFLQEYQFIKNPLEAFQKKFTKNLLSSQPYQELRNIAGLFLDIFGFLNHDDIKNELIHATTFQDRRLQYFAVSSLLRQGESVKTSLINGIAADSEMRNFLYKTLNEYEMLNFFPKEYLHQKTFAETDLINWLSYPTEMGHPPTEIECMEVVTRYDEDIGAVDYYVFRFKSEHEDWKESGWMAGISGYYIQGEAPSIYSNGYTFSLFESWETKSSEEHLDSIFEVINHAWSAHEEEN